MTSEYRRKLIEVALPLNDINDASAYDKMPGIGAHPKGIHYWWARLPLPAARAILFASIVDDPSSDPNLAEKPLSEQHIERERLFEIIRQLMQKRLHEHPEVYAAALHEIERSCDGELPTILDPFAGGGSIPLEANRMGLRAHAADLNPIAVLLNKCNLEVVPTWANQSPINPSSIETLDVDSRWTGAKGLAEDVRFYGRQIFNKANTRIGSLFPKIQLPVDYGQSDSNVIAWIWARTVASPNPAAHGAKVPLLSTFWLSSKKGKEYWLKPVVDYNGGRFHFEIESGVPPDKNIVSRGTKLEGAGFECIFTRTPISFDYIRAEGSAKRIGQTLVAIVAEVPRGRVYLKANETHAKAAMCSMPNEYPDTELPDEALGFRIQKYGFHKHWQMFTTRQLVALVTLSDLIKATTAEVVEDARASGMPLDKSEAYANAVVTFLALALDRCADFNNSFCRWKHSGQQSMNLFSLQAIPMVWDFAEPNILGEKAVCWLTAVDICTNALETISAGTQSVASASQYDAATASIDINNLLVSTDPPYYDNIGYSTLSDFYYVWLRRTIAHIYPELFSTVLVPKAQELTAAPEMHQGDKQMAKEHFENGFRDAFKRLRSKLDERFPLTVYYAFKQADEQGMTLQAENSPINRSTGWETLLEALVSSEFQITATWPIRASQTWRMRAMGSNALASYIVLACRPRTSDSPLATRREFISALKEELPEALTNLQHGNIAPVDLAQASIGPGMAVFTRYSKVLESDGSPMLVRTALGLINQMLDEVLAEQEGEFDADTRWAIAWFEQFGIDDGPFGIAETLSKAKDTAINGLVEAGILKAGAGKVRLLGREELLGDWDPATDKRPTVWEASQYLIRALDQHGEEGAAALLRKLGSGYGEIARDLAYRLYNICERKGWASEALAYNSLVIAWPEITRLARASTAEGFGLQTEMFESE